MPPPLSVVQVWLCGRFGMTRGPRVEGWIISGGEGGRELREFNGPMRGAKRRFWISDFRSPPDPAPAPKRNDGGRDGRPTRAPLAITHRAATTDIY
jgi:hypothetical protein